MLPNQNGKMLTLTLTYSHNISSMKSGATKLQKAAKKALLDDAFATTNREHDCIPEHYTCGISSVFKITAS